MSRRAREQSSGEIYHLIQRGLNRNSIFHDKEDKLYFLTLLKEQIEKYYIKVFAYIIMENHYHILAKLGLPNLFQLRELAHYLGIHEKTLGKGVRGIEDILKRGDRTILSKIDKILTKLEIQSKRAK